MKPGIQKLSTKFSYAEFLSYAQALFKRDSRFFDLSEEQTQHLYKNFSYADLHTCIIDQILIKQFPAKMAKACLAIPLFEEDGKLVVGLINPFNPETINTIESVLGKKITPLLVEKPGLILLFSKYYAHYEMMKTMADGFHPPVGTKDKTSFLGELRSSNKISEFFQYIIEDAEQLDASDIHIELFEKTLTVRFRVNGRLIAHKFSNGEIASYLLRYMKILANADIAQENLPVEGKHVSLTMNGGKKINLRMSIMPTGFGFSSVIRILPDNKDFDLKTILDDEGYYNELSHYLSLKQGMFIVSGPTGSGKSTTLYGAVATINTPDRKIITLEDPIEIKMEGLLQVQINADIGYDYATSLRGILRQDPDVIMVSEIRDAITAQTAMKAAITGHMVLSTIHTRSVRDIPLRLLDLGVDIFTISSALKLLSSQRLIRLLCSNCKVPHAVDPLQKDLIKKHFKWVKDTDFKNICQSKGCQFCHESGFSDRRIIFEHIRLNQAMMIALSDKNFSLYEEEVSKVLKGISLADNALSLAFRGETSLEEALSYMD